MWFWGLGWGAFVEGAEDFLLAFFGEPKEFVAFAFDVATLTEVFDQFNEVFFVWLGWHGVTDDGAEGRGSGECLKIPQDGDDHGLFHGERFDIFAEVGGELFNFLHVQNWGCVVNVSLLVWGGFDFALFFWFFDRRGAEFLAVVGDQVVGASQEHGDFPRAAPKFHVDFAVIEFQSAVFVGVGEFLSVFVSAE